MRPGQKFIPDFTARFWSKVNKEGPVHPTLGTRCWEWQESLVRGAGGGYGMIRNGGRYLRAHRASWKIANGSIPAGLFVLHHCDNRRCVRPDHLFLGTQVDNMQDRMRKHGPTKPKATQCRKGHALTPDNRATDGRCRICQRIKTREWKRRQRAHERERLPQARYREDAA